MRSRLHHDKSHCRYQERDPMAQCDSACQKNILCRMRAARTEDIAHFCGDLDMKRTAANHGKLLEQYIFAKEFYEILTSGLDPNITGACGSTVSSTTLSSTGSSRTMMHSFNFYFVILIFIAILY